MHKTSVTLTQVNGQRKYGGPPPGGYLYHRVSDSKPQPVQALISNCTAKARGITYILFPPVASIKVNAGGVFSRQVRMNRPVALK